MSVAVEACVIGQIKAVREELDDGTEFVWLSPSRYIRYRNDALIEASGQPGAMSIEEAHDYCDTHSGRTELTLTSSRGFVLAVTGGNG